jgi:hypothetical protein
VLFALGRSWPCWPTAGVTLLSAAVALCAGLDLFRLNDTGADPQRAADRLLGASLVAGVLLGLDLSLALFMSDDWSCAHGLANAGWILPFTVPLGWFGRRRYSSG